MRKKYLYQLSLKPEIHLNTEKFYEFFDTQELGWKSVEDCDVEQRQEALELLKDIFGNDSLTVTHEVLRASLDSFPAMVLDGALIPENSKLLNLVINNKEYKNKNLLFMTCLIYEEDN